MTSSADDLDFVDCATYCRNSEEDIHTDWRMPNAEELVQFLDKLNENVAYWTSDAPVFKSRPHKISNVADAATPIEMERYAVNLRTGDTIFLKKLTTKLACACVRCIKKD